MTRGQTPCDGTLYSSLRLHFSKTAVPCSHFQFKCGGEIIQNPKIGYCQAYQDQKMHKLMHCLH